MAIQTIPGLTGFTYARALRGIARQDQDVIMVAELKDKETAMLALHAASSGKLVLAGIEADSAAEAIDAHAACLILERYFELNPKAQ